MITRKQVQIVINNILNGKLPPLHGLPDRTGTLNDIGIYLTNNGYDTSYYFTFVKDHLDVRFCDLPDTIADVKVSYIKCTMNNLDKAINELLQLMLVDNKPVYLTQLTELYECKKKEIEIQQCIKRSEELLYNYSEPAVTELIQSQLRNGSRDTGYNLDQLANKHKLDPALLKVVLDSYVNSGDLFMRGDSYVGKFKIERSTYS